MSPTCWLPEEFGALKSITVNGQWCLFSCRSEVFYEAGCVLLPPFLQMTDQGTQKGEETWLKLNAKSVATGAEPVWPESKPLATANETCTLHVPLFLCW